DPAPVLPEGDPETGPPPEAGLPVDPATGNVGAVLVRGGRRGARVERRRRRRDVLRLFLVVRRPEPGDPLPAALDLLPVAGQPVALRGRPPPEAAHPDEVVLLVVVAPVAGDPEGAFRLLLGRHFRHRVGRPPGHHGRSLGASFGRPGVGFVD